MNPQQERPKKRDVNGWLALDKPAGMTSTQAVARVKWLFGARKAGHAGTLDPLATGCLPIAFGEATKTVPFAMDGRKIYRFTIAFGAETDSDDSDGRITSQSAERPSREALLAVLPRFTGTISQVPPCYSAIKVDGARAYDLARGGEDVILDARDIEVHSLSLVRFDGDSATLEAETGKGAYVRALARDIGRALACLGHVTALRRVQVGSFPEPQLVLLDALGDLTREGLDELLLPVEAALGELPALDVGQHDAARLKRGQSVLVRGRDAPVFSGPVYARSQGVLVALADFAGGELQPTRVFHLGA